MKGGEYFPRFSSDAKETADLKQNDIAVFTGLPKLVVWCAISTIISLFESSVENNVIACLEVFMKKARFWIWLEVRIRCTSYLTTLH